MQTIIIFKNDKYIGMIRVDNILQYLHDSHITFHRMEIPCNGMVGVWI